MDSLTRQEMDITPFKNILNDMYSRDISKKVLAGITTRAEITIAVNTGTGRYSINPVAPISTTAMVSPAVMRHSSRKSIGGSKIDDINVPGSCMADGG